MSEATGGGRAEMERSLIERSLADDAFRQRLLSDPKASVEQELGTRLPEDVRVVAVEETADTIYLVLPFASTEAQEAGELSDQDLEAVAGGWDAQTAGYTCGSQQTRCGVECV
jgi:Nitrile hydratase, alpha chain